MPKIELMQELNHALADSDSQSRKEWAEQIVQSGQPLQDLLPLLHADQTTAQRFMWLIGDICELEPGIVAPCLSFLFSLRDQMPFPGMRRSLAKWLWLTKVPVDMESVAIFRLLRWLDEDEYSIGCKSYAAKALFELATQDRVSVEQLRKILEGQANAGNKAFASRMQKLLDRLNTDTEMGT